MASVRPGHRDAFAVELPVGISAVEDCRLALHEYLSSFDIDPLVVNRIEVILEEMVSNVVRHADGADFVRLSAEHRPDSVALAFEDNGDAFNPLDKEEPDAFTTVAEATLGRQGIPLVKRLSREVGYQRIGDVNRITAIVALR